MSIAELVVLLVLPGCLLAVSFNNDWAAEVPGGPIKAREVAEQTACSLESEIIPGSNIFQFRCHHVRRRSTEPDLQAHAQIEEHEHVSWCKQQEVKSRTKRKGYWPGMQQWGMQGAQTRPQQQQQQPDPVVSDTPFEDPLHMNDERWPLMWYLNRGSGFDMNVQEAWQSGVTGKGIVVTILDDGVERHNPDLVENYDPQASYDVNDNDNDPNPRYDLVDSNRHGTRCAGEVSASANNSVCAVGIAYNSKIGGVRMLDGDVTDAVEARSISLNNQHIDIYSASWGPDDDGKTVDGPGNLAKRAFITGIQNGRGGKGSIFVWASGNGGRDHDNCNCDGYTNSIWTLSVSSATENGLIPWYSEACSSTMASTYSSGSSGERKVVSTDLHNKCTSTHTGTSASAPMAAGVIALVLEANPSLTWRDVQHITVRNCHVANLRATDWNVNAMGRNYSHSFGYGIMDASAMVRTARGWINVAEQKSSAVNADIGVVDIPPSSSRTAKMQVTDSGDVRFLEHVQAHITLTAARRGDVQIYLTSPGGTKSQLLARRPHDTSRAGFQDWPFLTVFCWGENPLGTWTLEVQNDGRYQVELRAWSLTFHGTQTDPDSPGPSAPQPKRRPDLEQAAESIPQPKRRPDLGEEPVEPAKPAVASAQPARPSTQPPTRPTQPSTYPTQPFNQPSTHPAPAPTQAPKQSVLPLTQKTKIQYSQELQSSGRQMTPLVPAMFENPLLDTEVPLTIENCLVQRTSAWCSSCKPGFIVLSGKCVTSCPTQGYYQGVSNMSAHCFQCYYTCQTCVGSNDYQCETCYGDAQIDLTPTGDQYCHNKNLVFKVFSSSRWYYILSLGFLVNTILIIVLVIYIYKKKKNAGGLYRGNVLDRVISPSSKGYKPVSPSDTLTVPAGRRLRDDEDDSSDEDHRGGFMTPYSDNPAVKQYRDQKL